MICELSSRCGFIFLNNTTNWVSGSPTPPTSTHFLYMLNSPGRIIGVFCCCYNRPPGPPSSLDREIQTHHKLRHQRYTKFCFKFEMRIPKAGSRCFREWCKMASWDWCRRVDAFILKSLDQETHAHPKMQDQRYTNFLHNLKFKVWIPKDASWRFGACSNRPFLPE